MINASFARAASTEQALLLLRQFESLLERDSFRADLDAKYLQAFQVGLPGWAGEQFVRAVECCTFGGLWFSNTCSCKGHTAERLALITSLCTYSALAAVCG